jgi:hypothetical protein
MSKRKMEDEARVKVRVELDKFTTYPRPEKSFYLQAKVCEMKCDGDPPSWYSKLKVGKKIHLQTRESLYDLDITEEENFFDELPQLLCEANLTFYVKFWKESSDRAVARASNEVEGVFNFNWAKPICITM